MRNKAVHEAECVIMSSGLEEIMRSSGLKVNACVETLDGSGKKENEQDPLTVLITVCCIL